MASNPTSRPAHLPPLSFHIRGAQGIDNKKNITDVDPTFFEDAQNVDLSTPLRIDKRRGFAKFNTKQLSGSGSIQSLHRYVGSAATDLWAYTTNGQVYRATAAGGTFDTQIASGLDVNAPANTAQFGGRRVSSTSYAGRIFFVNGSDENKSYSDVDGWQKMGITPPATAPTLAALGGYGSAAMASGDYYFKVTYYNSAKGLESNPSQATTVVTLTATASSASPSAANLEAVSLTNIPVASDPQVVYKRLYRTFSGGGTYYYLAQLLNSATVYTATAADALLGDEVETDNNVPPSFKYIEEYQACLFGAGDDSDSVTKSLLYYSKQLDDSPESWPSSYYLSITPDDGDEVTLLRKVGNRLIVAKKNSWGIVVGESPSTFRYAVIDNSHGCIAPRSVAMTENAVIFLSSDGFRICDGTRSELLCKDTLDLAELGLNYAQLSKFRGVYWRDRKQYVCLICTGTKTVPDKAVKIQFPSQAWTLDVYGTGGLVELLQFYDGDGEEHIYAGSASGGYVHEMFGASVWTDDGSNPTWHFTFGPNWHGNKESAKRFHTLVIDADNSSTPQFWMAHKVDGGALSTPVSVTATNKETRQPAVALGKYIQFKLSGASDSYVRFNDFEIKAGVEKPRRL